MTAVPTTFGKYYLTEKIAAGGMAEIYLAKLLGPGGFEKQLIIKQIHPELSGRPHFVQLFVEEAKTLVSLSHGNIVPVYELGVVNDRYFIAMEYIDGPSLDRLQRNVVRGGKEMEPAVAAYIGSELLKGLDYAHRKGDGLIHRDLSPRNVMISREGEVKLVDFGLAVTIDGRQLKSGAGGRPVGSFPYMSPEQVRREPLDGQSDVFSAGVLLWEMLTGRSLFARATEDETLEAVTDEPIPAPSDLRPSLAPELDVICASALARDKAARYRSAGAFLAALNKYIYSVHEPATAHTLSELVARIVPPSRRERAATANRELDEVPEDREDRTKPMGAERPRGKRRADTVRTFATQAEFEEVLAKGGISSHGSDPDDSGAQRGDPTPTAASRPRAETVPPLRSARTPWLIAGIAAVAAVTASAIAFRAGGARNALDAAPIAAGSADAGTPAPVDAAPPPETDGAPPRIPGDAAPPEPDAGRRRRKDAGPGPVAPQGSGVLTVGASPRGDVFVDGKLVGEAPGNWELPAGSHRVVVKYKDQSKSFKVSIAPGGKASVPFIEFER